jgi:serine/threonine protein kinase
VSAGKKYIAMSCEVTSRLGVDRADDGPKVSDRLGARLLTQGALVCGRYEVSHYIGSGSVGDVVAARHLGLATTVALKFLRAEHLAVPGASLRFSEAARKNVPLTSEHIARVYDVDAHKGIPFIAMEDLGPRHLRALLEAQERFEHKVAVDTVLQVCEALATAHALGVPHCDIKPENIFALGPNFENIKVVDCGISARALQLEEATPQRDSQVRPSAQPYWAPEQIRDSVAGDVRSDIWSLGCLLFELLAGKSPFDRGNSMSTWVAIIEEAPNPIADEQRDVPDGLWHVIVRCLRKNPDARFSDTAALADALVPFGSGRYSYYAERCHARLAGVTRSVPLESPAAHHSDDPVSEVRSLPVAVTSPAVGIVRTLVVDPPKLTPEQCKALEPSQGELANQPQSHEVAQQHRPRLSLALLCALLCLLAVCVGTIARKHAAEPRLQHLVTPRTQNP